MNIAFQNIDILKRAMPHVTESSRRSLDVVIKLAELNTSVSSINQSNTLAACSSSSKSNTSIEELLKSIRPACSKSQTELIDVILNFTKSRDILTAYKAMSSDFSSDSL